MNYCPHCMRPAEGDVCPHCSGDINWTALGGQLPLGTFLHGSNGHLFQIGAAKGQGGFGITYAALDLTDNVRVAIKEYFPGHCALRSELNHVVPVGSSSYEDNYKKGLKSFLEEAKMLAAVGALPSVVEVRDFFRANGTAYIVMEYVDGEPLQKVVKEKGKIPADKFLLPLKDLMEDLELLHRANIIHRDITPDNLILMPDGRLKLIDFGSSRSLQDREILTVLLKSGFSPVEQYTPRGQGPWTDVYSLAATVYYCLTGVTPPLSVDRLLSDELVHPSKLGAGLSAQQEASLLHALEINSKSRYRSVQEWMTDMFSIGDLKSEIEEEHEPVHEMKTVPVPQPMPKTEPIITKPEKAEEDIKVKKTIPEKITEPSPEVTRNDTKKKKPNKTIAVIPALLAVVIGICVMLFIPKNKSDSGDIPDAEVPDVSAPVGSADIKYSRTDDGFLYSLSEDGEGIIITGYEGEGGDITIPGKLSGLPVVGIGQHAFADRNDITAIRILGSITPDETSFEGCDGLTAIYFIFDYKNNVLWTDIINSLPSVQGVLFPTREGFRTFISRKEDPEETMGITYIGRETPYGLVVDMEVTENMVFALTDKDRAIIIHSRTNDMPPRMIRNKYIVTGYYELIEQGV